MFGLDKKFKEAHVLSHLEDAAISWLLEPGNPVIAKVPTAGRSAVIAELQAIDADAKKAIAGAPASVPPSTPAAS